MVFFCWRRSGSKNIDTPQGVKVDTPGCIDTILTLKKSNFRNTCILPVFGCRNRYRKAKGAGDRLVKTQKVGLFEDIII